MLEMLQNLDGSLLLAIQGLRQEWLNPLVAAYTHLGDEGLIWIAFSAAMLCYRPTRRTGLTALVALLFMLVLNNMTIKPLVARPRPWLDVEGIVPLIVERSVHSFPSGHSSGAFAAAMVWAKELPWRWARVLAVVMAACMALSRLYVGVHYPADVLAGVLVGCLCAWAARRIVKLAANVRKPDAP